MRFLPLASGILLLAAITPSQSQELVAPINMVWRASSETATSSSTTALMRTTAYRTQLMYDNSHFLAQGVTGPIAIRRLRFRGEDTEPNLGGQVWTNVSVTLSDTPAAINTATMSTTFASNIGPNVGVPTVLPTLTMGLASGSVPNDYIVDIALAVPFLYDPTTMGCLLVDVTSPNVPVPATGISPLACSSTQATHLARLVSSTTPTALSGTLSALVPVCRFDFAGPGGFFATIPARVDQIGASCGANADSFYQDFAIGEPFDLRQQTLVLTPNNPAAPTLYQVRRTATPVDLTQCVTLLSTADDATIAVPIPFSFNFVGGSVSTVRPCTNGFCWLNATNTSTDLSPTVAELLGGGSSAFPARVALCWKDLHAGRNLPTHPLCGMYSNIDTSGGPGNTVVYITWREVGEFNTVSATGGHSVNDFQLVLHEATMEMEMRFGAITGLQGGGIVTGFSPGTRGGGVNSTDPGSRDLSIELSFQTNGPDGAAQGIKHTLSARPVNGTSIAFNASPVPATSLIGVTMLSFGVVQPGISVPPLAFGCISSLPLPSLTYDLQIAPPASLTTPPLALPSAAVPGWLGAVIHSQFATLDAGGFALASNALRIQLGLR